MGGRPLPERVTGVVELLAPAVLGALVAVQTLGDGPALTIDERLVGVAAAGIALWRKAPLLVVAVHTLPFCGSLMTIPPQSG